MLYHHFNNLFINLTEHTTDRFGSRPHLGPLSTGMQYQKRAIRIRIQPLRTVGTGSGRQVQLHRRYPEWQIVCAVADSSSSRFRRGDSPHQHQAVCQCKLNSILSNCLNLNVMFLQLVLTKSNKLYTWGASPQALRLANQARKRARSSHKCRPNVMTPAATAGPSTSPPSAEPEAKTDGPEPESKSLTVSNVPEESNEEQQPKIEPEVEQQPAEGVDETPKTPNGGPVPDIKIEDTSAGEESKTPDVDEKAATPGEEFAEHLFPSLVDTTLVQDDIVRVSVEMYSWEVRSYTLFETYYLLLSLFDSSMKLTSKRQ